MPKLFNADNGDYIGEISQAQLEFLVSEMEEESADDHDYYLDPDMLDVLEEDGAEPELVALLQKAMGTATSLNIRWED